MKICVLQVFIPAGTPALAEIPAIIPVEGYKPVVVDTADNISFILSLRLRLYQRREAHFESMY